MGLHFAVLLIAGAFVAATSLLFLPFTVDDALIVARYAVNARDLGEWAFNQGESVSALTSPLHGALMVGLAFVAADPIPLYKGIAVVVVMTASTMCLVRYGASRRETLLLAAVLAAPALTMWTFAGLETPLLMGLVTVMATVFSLARRDDGRALATLGMLAGATVLTRYDAVLFAGPVMLAALARPHSWRTRILAAALAVVPVLAWFLYSWLHFGSVLPTSFYLKTPTAALDVLVVNLRYMAEHLAIAGVAIMTVYTAARLLAGGEALKAIAGELRTRWGLHVALAAVLAYGAMMATVHMMFALRHLVPYLGATALALALLAQRAGVSEPRVRRRWLEPAAALLILTVHGFHAEALYRRSLQGLGTSGEYAEQGTAGYTSDFIPAMRRNAADTRAHWERLNKGRPPRIWTFAAGALPSEYPEAYIFEALVSFRQQCPVRKNDNPPDSRRWRAHSDYIHAFTRHAQMRRLLDPLRLRDLELISEQPLHFNGRNERLLVFYNKAATPNVLPPRIDDPCLTPQDGHE